MRLTSRRFVEYALSTSIFIIPSAHASKAEGTSTQAAICTTDHIQYVSSGMKRMVQHGALGGPARVVGTTNAH